MRRKLYGIVSLATALSGVIANRAPCLTPSCVTLAADILASVDTTADPCESFYAFANGKWLDEHEIPAGQIEHGPMSDIRVEQNQKIIQHALEEDVEGKLGDMWTSCMNVTRIDEVGIAPMRILINEIVDILHNDQPRKERLTDLMIWLHQRGIKAFFSIETDPDIFDASRPVVVMDAARAGLRSSEFRDPESVKIYSQVISSVLQELQILQDDELQLASNPLESLFPETQQYLGDSEQRGALVDRVIHFERVLQDAGPTVLNEAWLPTWHPFSIADLSSILPNIDVQRYLAAMQSAGGKRGDNGTQAFGTAIDKVIVRYPEYVKALSSLLEKQSISTILAYSVLRTAFAFAIAIGADTEIARQVSILYNFRLGIKNPSPVVRSKTCLDVIDRTMGHWAGAVFVNATWQDTTMTEVHDMFQDIRANLMERFSTVSWMSDATRVAAARKASNMTPLIGYPHSPGVTVEGLEKWYADLQVTSADFFGNVVRSTSTEVERAWARLSQASDLGEWNVGFSVYAHTVNAAYTGPSNTIVLPAGILLPVWFDPDWPMAAKYGAIGGLIGHEVTHGFDNDGREYDEDGRLRDWWDNKTVSAYTERANCFARQYSGYWYLDEQGNREYINGTVTNAQDIADSGLINAWSAWQTKTTVVQGSASASAEAGQDNDLPLAGLPYSSEQLFWISFARTWTALQSPAAARNKIINGESTPRWRVDGTLSNIRAFHDTWGCKIGDGMRLRKDDEVCKLW